MKLTILTLVMAVLFAIPAFGITIRVPADFETIQEGIDNAVDGDSVVVADGTYTGDGNRDIDFLGKAIVVKSENGPEVTVVDCEGSEEDPHRGFYFHTNEDTLSILLGFTIRNGYESLGGGVCCDSSYPVVENCIISGNTADSNGGGFYCLSISGPTITDCTLSENISYYGGGISCGGTYPVIENCTIKGNMADLGGGIYCDFNSYPIITNCTISGNTAYSNSGGIFLNVSRPTITNCTISGNTAYYDGGGIYLYHSEPKITNCILWDDSPDEIRVDGGTPYVKYSDIQGGWVGEGNIDADPLYLDPESDNFHLTYMSPCIDRGIGIGAPEIDIEGYSRLDHPDMPNDPSIWDMGAYEYSTSIAEMIPAFLDLSVIMEETETETLSICNIGNLDLTYSIDWTADWLDVIPVEGSVPPESQETIKVTCIATDLLPDTYQDTLVVTTNAEDNPVRYVPVTLTVLSPITTVLTCDYPSAPRGGYLEFRAGLANVTGEQREVDAWLDLYLLSGDPYPFNPLLGPAHFVMGPYYEGFQDREVYVPYFAPLGGPYTLFLRCGDYPEVWDESWFEFSVVPPEK